MAKVVVLGGSGMLGVGVLQAFQDAGLQDVAYTTRDSKPVNGFPHYTRIGFDADELDFEQLRAHLFPETFVVNCIGVIKPYIKDADRDQRLNAMKINGLFPDTLDALANEIGFKVIQIATDCVYSGTKGSYVESDLFDATDVYGKTKSLGEVPSSNFMHLRVSIIGPEFGRSTSLFEWVRNQPKDSEISGFTDHEWNGVTTYHFGKLCAGIVTSDLFVAGVQHVVPASRVTKFQLVSAIANRAGRSDIRIVPKPSGTFIDRTLDTEDQERNLALWVSAGYSTPPTVEQMISEMPI
jgi:dTDP-4-dehydrorhamnose reductase